MAASPRTTHRNPTVDEGSRLLPLSIATLICFVIAMAAGYGGWYFFGTHNRETHENTSQIIQAPITQPSSQNAPTPSSTPAPTPRVVRAPAGELRVSGGEVVLGGGDTGIPVRREFVEDFLIAETEVTNEQYREFVKATGHKAPGGWNNGEFPPGAATEPVTNVTWQDAVDYCRWLSEQTGATVRLPTEAEWQLAARGKENYEYPWGNQWDDRAAASDKTNGRVHAVKSYPAGKSPIGAYDMAGNVWEWVADEVRGEDGKPKTENDVTVRIVKGGSAEEEAANISAISRVELPGDEADSTIGFRYVVGRG